MQSSSPATLSSLALSNLTSLTTLASQIAQANLTTPTIQNETKAAIPDAILPKKGSAEEEHSFSMAIFFVLTVIGKVPSKFLGSKMLTLINSRFPQPPASL